MRRTPYLLAEADGVLADLDRLGVVADVAEAAGKIRHAVGDQRPWWRIEPLCLLDQLGETFGTGGGAVYVRGPERSLEASAKRRLIIRAKGSGRHRINLPGHGQRLARVSGATDLAGQAQTEGRLNTQDDRGTS